MKKYIYYCDICLRKTAKFKKIYLTDENENRVKHLCLSCYKDFIEVFKEDKEVLK